MTFHFQYLGRLPFKKKLYNISHDIIWAKTIPFLLGFLNMQWNQTDLNQMRWRNRLAIYMSRDMRFQTMWYVRPEKGSEHPRTRAVLSEPLPGAWKFHD